MTDDEATRRAAITRYVSPDGRYARLTGAGLLRQDAAFVAALVRDAEQITDDDLERLLNSGCRETVTAGYLVGIGRRTQHRDRIVESLRLPVTSYAAQGCCFALARFGAAEDARLLSDILDAHLPKVDKYHYQEWALGTLAYLDPDLAATHHEAWDRWAATTPMSPMDPDPDFHRQRVADLCAFVERLV